VEREAKLYNKGSSRVNEVTSSAPTKTRKEEEDTRRKKEKKGKQEPFE
jgi:hypothetical protein